MTKDEILKLARENGNELLSDPGGIEYLFYRKELLAFVDIAVKAEREACAKFIESYPEWIGANAKQEISAAIRERSNHDQL